MSPVQGVDTALHSQAQLLLAAAAIRNKTGSGHQHRDSGATQCTVGTVGTLATSMRDPDETAASAQCIYIIYTL